MAAPRILVSTDAPPRRSAHPTQPVVDGAWNILAVVGVVFAGLGLLDVALAWIPADFSSPEWEFGTITASANGLPLPALGLLLVLAAGVATGSRWKVRSASVVMLVLSVLILALALLYVTVIPVALGAVDNALVRTGLVKAMIKASVLLLVFPTLFIWLAIRGWRRSSV